MTSHADHLAWIDGQQARMVRLVTAWSDINSGSLNLPGLERCAAAIRQELHRLGGDIEMISLPPMAAMDDAGRETTRELGKLIRVRKHPAVPVQVLVGIHYDTVYGPEHSFQHATLSDDGSSLNGPGVADAKGGIVVMLTALAALERSPLAGRIGWDLFLNPDEELGSPGSSPVIEAMAAGKAIGLLFEPALADGSLVSERKGSGNFTAVVTGRAAHAGRDPQLGRNAVHALAEFVVAVAALNDPAAGVSANVGRIFGGTAPNVVPDLASCRFNVRVRTAAQQRDVEQRLVRLADEINGREGFTLRLHGGFTAPPKPLDGPTEVLLEQIAACGRELGLPPLDWRASGGVCDGNRLAAAGLPTVDTLGPIGWELHSDREYLLLNSLAERAKLAALVLMMIASGEFVLSGAAQRGTQ